MGSFAPGKICFHGVGCSEMGSIDGLAHAGRVTERIRSQPFFASRDLARDILRRAEHRLVTYNARNAR